MTFPREQTTDTMGDINLEDEVAISEDGLDEAKQISKIKRAARAYNELMPQILLWERYSNNPSMDGLHICGCLPDDDPIYQNSPYADSFVTIQILDGTLYPCNQ